MIDQQINGELYIFITSKEETMAKGLGYGTKIASKQTKDGDFKGACPRKQVGGCYNNPSKAKGLIIPKK